MEESVMSSTVTVMLDDDSVMVLPYDDAMRLWMRLRWALEKEHNKSGGQS